MCTIDGGARTVDYPVKSFSGTKSIVISTASWSGGRQSFLGWSYVALAVFCMLCAVAGTARHLWKPRCVGPPFPPSPHITMRRQVNSACD